MTYQRCKLCGERAEVSWPTRNSPHCLRCVREAQSFIAATEAWFPSLTKHAPRRLPWQPSVSFNGVPVTAVRASVLEAIRDGKTKKAEILATVGGSPQRVDMLLRTALRKGEVIRTRHGRYALRLPCEP